MGREGLEFGDKVGSCISSHSGRPTRLVVTGSDDGTAKLWHFTERDVKSCTTLTSDPSPEEAWQGHSAGLTSVSFGPATTQGPRVLTGSKDKTAKIWALDGSLCRTLPRAADGPAVASPEQLDGGARGGLALPREWPPEVGHADCVNVAAWRPRRRRSGRDTQAVLTCSDDHSAVVWHPEAGQPLYRMLASRSDAVGHSGPVPMAEWSQAGSSRVLTCSHDRTCIIWDGSGAPVISMPTSFAARKDAHEAAIWSAHFSADDSMILTTSKDRTVKVWRTNHGVCTQTLQGAHTDYVLGAVWNHVEPHQVMTCSMDGTAKLWDLRESGRPVTLGHHTACVWSAVFGNDPRLLITASHDMTALIYDQRLQLPRNTLAGHTGILWQASFSADDTLAVTCSEDTTARVWNLFGGAQLPPCHTLQAGPDRHTQAVTCAAFLD